MRRMRYQRLWWAWNPVFYWLCLQAIAFPNLTVAENIYLWFQRWRDGSRKKLFRNWRKLKAGLPALSMGTSAPGIIRGGATACWNCGCHDYQPKILPRYEPFSALGCYWAVAGSTKRITKSLMTTIFVNHDTDEALNRPYCCFIRMGDRQVKNPETILKAPARLCGRLVGEPWLMNCKLSGSFYGQYSSIQHRSCHGPLHSYFYRDSWLFYLRFQEKLADWVCDCRFSRPSRLWLHGALSLMGIELVCFG